MLIISFFLYIFYPYLINSTPSPSELICRPFLSGKNSPLGLINPRNLSLDENGEYECEIVLQDLELPLQIRATIHEGLSILAIKHCNLGLRRQIDIVRHLEILTGMIPSAFPFSFRSGIWAMDVLG